VMDAGADGSESRPYPETARSARSADPTLMHTLGQHVVLP
jgi:hypothetical protein